MNHSIYSTSAVLLTFLIIFELATLHQGQARIIFEPMDTDAVIGDTAVFNCSSSIPSTEIHWFYYDSKHDARKDYVYGYEKIFPNYENFRIEKDNVTGAYNLIIPAVAASNAGKYECQDDIGRGERRSAQLIVLDGVPVCQSSPAINEVIGPNNCGIETSLLTLSCAAQYKGNQAPVLEWKKRGHNSTITEGVTIENLDNRIVYNLKVKGDLIENGSIYNCKATRSKSTKANCTSGKIALTGKYVTPGVVSCFECQPYIVVIVCIILIPLFISGIAFGIWYHLVDRIKNHKLQASKEKDKEINIPLQSLVLKQQPFVVVVVCVIFIFVPIFNGGFIFLAWYLTAHKLRTQKIEVSENLPNPRDNKNELSKPVEQTYSEIEESQSIQQDEVTVLINRRISEIDETKLEMPTNRRNSKVDETVQEEKDAVSKAVELQQEQAGKIRKLREDNRQLYNENQLFRNQETKLNVKIKDLERLIYQQENIQYLEKPSLAHRILIRSDVAQPKQKKSMTTKKENDAIQPKEEKLKNFKSIKGLTVLKNDLFVFVVYDNFAHIEVFDSVTYQYQRNVVIPGKEVKEPFDIASCKPDNCIFTIANVKDEPCSQLLKLDPNGNPLPPWPKPSGGNFGHLSVYESNLIVCLQEKQVINEYRGDGELIHTVRLSPAAGLIHPWHAIKTTSMHFIVSHGDLSDNLHRVCVVDLNGNIIKECSKWDKYGYKPYRELKVPIFLLEDDERSILVADRDNGRILLFNSVLKLRRTLVENWNGLKQSPIRICFDETKSRLCVSTVVTEKDRLSGEILIFNIK